MKHEREKERERERDVNPDSEQNMFNTHKWLRDRILLLGHKKQCANV